MLDSTGEALRCTTLWKGVGCHFQHVKSDVKTPACHIDFQGMLSANLNGHPHLVMPLDIFPSIVKEEPTALLSDHLRRVGFPILLIALLCVLLLTLS